MLPVKFQALILIIYKIRRRRKKSVDPSQFEEYEKLIVQQEDDNENMERYKSNLCLIPDTNMIFETHITDMIAAVNGNCKNYSYGSV